MKLYDYYRSTACYRVRIALHLKNIPYTKVPIHLTEHGGEQHHAAYHHINPQELVPSLEDQGQIIHQSLAIIDYLEECHPQYALLPQSIVDKAKIRALALLIACDIHPLNNLRVLTRLKTEWSASETQITEWYHHWLTLGFDAFEAQLRTLKRSKPVCFGDTASLADVCLIPQVYNAQRFHFPLTHYPLIQEINEYCLTIEAFNQAAP